MILAWLKGRRASEAQIWRDRETSGRKHFASIGWIIAEFEIKPEEENFSIDELKVLYPCPK